MWRTSNLVTWEEVLWNGHSTPGTKFVNDIRQLYTFMGRLYRVDSDVIDEYTFCASNISYYRDNNDIIGVPVQCNMPDYRFLSNVGDPYVDSGLQLATWSGVAHKGRFGVPGWTFNKDHFNEFYGLEANATTPYFAGWLVTTDGDTFYGVPMQVDQFTTAAEIVTESVNLGFNSASPEIGNYYLFMKDYAMFGPRSYSRYYHDHGAYPMASIDGRIVNLGANYCHTPGYDNGDGTNRYGNEVYRCDDFGDDWTGYNIGPPGFYTGNAVADGGHPSWTVMFGDRLFWGSLVDDSHNHNMLDTPDPTCHLYSTMEGLVWTYDAKIVDQYTLRRYKDCLPWSLTMQYMTHLYPRMNNDAILELLLAEFVYNPDDSLMIAIVWADVRSALIVAQLLYVNAAVEYMANLKSIYDYYAGYVYELITSGGTDVFSGVPKNPPPWLSVEEVRVSLQQDVRPSIEFRAIGSKDGMAFLAGRLASAGSVDESLSSTKARSYGAVNARLGVWTNPVRF
jgi:hypothetical protein